MTAHTVPTFGEVWATLAAEQQRLLDAMDAAITSKDHAKYAAHHARFIELGSAFDALWHFKIAQRASASKTGGAA